MDNNNQINGYRGAVRNDDRWDVEIANNCTWLNLAKRELAKKKRQDDLNKYYDDLNTEEAKENIPEWYIQPK